MIYQMLKAPMDSVKRWAEQMYHRAQGHMLISIVTVNGTPFQFWVKDFYTDDAILTADLCNGDTLELNMFDRITITGA